MLEPLFATVSRRSLKRDLHVLLARGLIREVGGNPTDPKRGYTAP